MSDILDVFHLVKLAKAAGQTSLYSITETKEQIANEYLAYTRATNMVDQFDLLRILKQSMQDSEDLRTHLSGQGHVVVNLSYYCDERSVEKELLQTLFDVNNIRELKIEQSLDSSLNDEEDNKIGVNAEVLESWDQFYSGNKSLKNAEDSSGTERYVQQWVEGYLRLLINSRDELSLGRILCGPCGVLENPEAFHVIRKESGKTRMPIFQTIVSYVQRSKLTGNREAPTSEHPFFPFQKELSEFNEFMEKLQDKIEDEKDAEAACRKILNSLRSLALKRSSSLKVGKMDACFATLGDLSGAAFRRLASMSAAESGTPKRNTGAGGSMAGKKNVKVTKKIMSKEPEGRIQCFYFNLPYTKFWG